jgi:methionine-R-sulfoxide reductase
MRRRALIIAAVLLTGFGGATYYAYAQGRPSMTDTSPAAQAQLRDWVMDEGGTERAFQNAYWDNHEAGLYVEARTGEALFASSAKYESGTGWPSFSRPVSADALTRHEDRAWGMRRVEVRSREGDAHLGHVFDDGPRSAGGLRYCINSAALRFIPRDRMQAEGYGRYLPIVDGARQATAN